MFNLLVSGGGWKQNRGTISKSRVLEYTAPTLKETFKPGGVLDIPTIVQLPTLFMPENQFTDEIAHVGRITSVREDGTNYELTYTWDPSIRPLSNAEIETMMTDLDIDRFEFSRTHWAIKNGDLFYALIRKISTRLAPKIFDISNEAVNPKLIAVMMPFKTQFDAVYSAIANVVHDLDRDCQRADDIWKNDVIIKDVVHLIDTSRVVVCDLSGKNSNVFYETGIAHTLGKDVVMITQSGDDIPFDLRHVRYISYLNNAEGRDELATQLRSRLETLFASGG